MKGELGVWPEGAKGLEPQLPPHEEVLGGQSVTYHLSSPEVSSFQWVCVLCNRGDNKFAQGMGF